MEQQADVQQAEKAPLFTSSRVRGGSPAAQEQLHAQQSLPVHTEAQTGWKDRADSWWAWEIGGLIGSALCIMGLCLFLASLQEKPVPIWAYKFPGSNDRAKVAGVTTAVSINSVIGWFSTISKLLLLIPITNGLGQLKWVWFSEDTRVLTDFEVFDSATRGITGSAVLLWRFKASHFAVLGAAVMILSLAFDPLVQNLAAFPNAYHLARDYSYIAPERSSIAWTNSFNATNRGDSTFGQLSQVTQSYVLSSLFDTNDHIINPDWSTPLTWCRGDICWFQPTPTLSVWTYCTDLTSRLTKTCRGDSGCDLALPNGFSLGNGTSGTTLAAVSTIQSSGKSAMVYKEYEQNNTYISIFHSIGVHADDLLTTSRITESTRIVATECAIVPAVVTYTGETRFNQTKADLYSWDAVFSEEAGEVYAQPRKTNGGDIILTPPANSETKAGEGKFKDFTIASASFQALRNYVDSILPGYVAVANNTQRTYVSTMDNSLITRAIYGYPFGCSLNNQSFADTAACHAIHISTAISTSIRNAPYLEWARNNPMVDNFESDFVVEGALYAYLPTVIISWYWVLVPVILWALALVFLLGVIYRTRRSKTQTWRTNPLPVVFLDIDAREDDRNGKQGGKEFGLTTNGFVEKAEQLRVRLRVDKKVKLIEE